MRRVAIVQARMGSTRLPGKVLEDLAGRPMLLRIIERLRRCSALDEIIVATTTLAEDDILCDVVGRSSARCCRGSADDVLSRFLGAAREASADVAVRITADCPLIEPQVVDLVVQALLTGPFDYASNILDRTYPRGLDTEALHRDVLERIDRLATSRAAREHVTWYVYRERPDIFLLRSVVASENDADLRWTVDTPDDLRAIRALYSELGLAERTMDYRSVVAYVRAHPELGEINAGVRQRSP